MDVIGDWAPGQPLLVVDIDERRRVVQVARSGPRLAADDARRGASRVGACRAMSPS